MCIPEKLFYANAEQEAECFTEANNWVEKNSELAFDSAVILVAEYVANRKGLTLFQYKATFNFRKSA